MLTSILRGAALLGCIALAQSALAQTTVTLQQGLNGYTGTSDTRLGNQGQQEGSATTFALIQESSTSFAIRFAIFQSEGGPVPDGATINSATLSFYKFSGPASTLKVSRFLKNWTEMGATWTVTGTGQNWTTAGAMSAGNDYLAAADGQASIPAEAAWLDINVTSGVQAFASGTANFGWKLADIGGQIGGTPRNFNASENTNWPDLRPKLTISYSSAPPPGGSSVTLQDGLNGYTGTADTKLGNQGLQEGSATNAALIQESSTSFAIRFAIFQSEGGPVPDGANISSATLSLYKNSGPSSVLKASRFLKNWTEMGATWTVTGAGQNWTTAGAMSAGNDYLAAADGQGSIADGAAWLNVDVTAGVQAFASGTANHGWKIADIGGQIGGTPRNFNTSDYNNSAFRPKLTISYGGGPTAPTANLTATPSQGAGPLTVTFNASGSTDNGSPITNLRLQFGHNAQEVNWSDKNQTQQYTYPAGAAQYTATLTVTNAIGNSNPPATRTITVTTGQVPTAQLSANPSSGQPPLTVSFDASGSSDNGSPITSLTLQYGDGSQVTFNDKNQLQSHQYVSNGSYVASLTATNAHGTSSPATQTIQVSDGTDIPPGSPAAGALGSALPTFHSMSLYYAPAGTPPGNRVWLRYRKAAESTWHEGYPLWFDSRTFSGILQARGSAVHLQPGTKYYFEFGTGASYAGAAWQHHVSGTTWNTRPDNVADDPSVVSIAAGSSKLTIGSGGNSASGYKVYDGWNGSSMNQINVGAAADNCIRISVSYVVVRRVVCRGGTRSGIEIDDGVTNVVIEDVEVTDFTHAALSDTSWGNRGENDTAAVRLGTHSGSIDGNNSKIVVQRSKLHTPRWGARPWHTGGAPGPYGIFVDQGGQQNVFRYNDIYSGGTDHQWFQDGIGGSNNFGEKGAPGADSDIYQNIVRNAYDDGIEAEGGGRNVRIWGNYVDHVSVSIATTTVHFGPTYVWRNVMNRHRHLYDRAHDSDERNRGFKTYGVNAGFGGGRKYFFHNTFLQTPGSTVAATNPLGAGAGNSASSGTQSMRNTWSYNNIYHVWKTNWDSVYFGTVGSSDNAFDYDVYNAQIDNAAGSTPADGSGSFEQNGSLFSGSQLAYKPSHGWSSMPALGGNGTGNYQLETGSVGLDDGRVLPNFNDGYGGTAPDAGAHESGSAPMRFGISAGQ
jgi:PKD repeat protein